MAQSQTLLIFVNTPTNTAELQKMCDEARRHYYTQSDALGVLGDDLRNKLAKVVPGSPVLFGMDSKMVARRVTKHLKLAAELNGQSARAFQACWAAYQEYVLNTKEQAKAGFQV